MREGGRCRCRLYLAISMSKQFCNKGHDTYVVGRYNSGTCKVCMSENGIRWRKENADRQRSNAAIWQEANKLRYKNGRIVRNWKRRGLVLTRTEYDRLFAEQQGRCAICKVDANTLIRALCVDHNHTTGKVRGLLCYKCNSGLGFFQDKTELVEKAIQYLKGEVYASI